ncbi:BTAD domain-containing putative transcriptional regulator [Streptomyces sp. sk2.1]|uniref:AfsR/SARP family transcriptional regulator n=1 Tax=Streptomyces sp. sk2.1 TaxID=2478959 RepID=UPI001652C440|nr:BTAD domain-containing putative transcriptional regulator [Streptomyces sp. sk2.1]
MLATLLVRANEIVSVDGLIDELWGENPPRTATTTLQVYVSQLRKLLHEADAEFGRDALVTRPPGYELRIDPAQLDLTVFEELHGRGREVMERQDYRAAADLQRQALGLWRGPLLSDTPHGPLLDATAVRLAEVRTAALEQCIRAELHLGRHRELIGELQSVVAELPLREEFHAHLMVALYRSGRQADALQVFGRLRRGLVDELAIEPGRSLQALHQRILVGDPSLLRPTARAGHAPAPGHAPGSGHAADPGRAPGSGHASGSVGHVPGAGPDAGSGPARAVGAARAAGPVPAPGSAASRPQVPSGGSTVAQLPPADELFTGREEELAALRDVLGAPGGRLVIVTGTAGVGKTALALTVAHRTGDLFDVPVFVRLRPDGRGPLDAVGVLTGVLRRYGVRGPLPERVGELRDMVAESTDGRRVLLVLDDVADAEQVRPVLSAVPDCTVLVTCRRVPDGLAGRVVRLDVPTAREARRLFAAAAGQPADVAEGAECAGVVESCGRLPLALRAAADALTGRSRLPLGGLAARLRDERTRLAELEAASPGFRARLCAALDGVGAAELRAFRLFGLLPAGPFAPDAAAAVLDTDVATARATTDSLVRARLLCAELPSAGRPDHHHLPELLRLLARERLQAEEEPEAVRAALARLCGAFARAVEEAGPSGPTTVDGAHPLEWFRLRLPALMAVVRQAHAARLWAQCLRLVDGMTGFLEVLGAWEERDACQGLALEAAQHLGDLAAQARLLRSLGDLAWQRRRLDTAGELYERALMAADVAGAEIERCRALTGLAGLRLDAGATDAAAALVPPALDCAAQDARTGFEAHRVLGLLALESGEREVAQGHFTTCLTYAASLADARLESYARRRLDGLDSGGPTRPGWSEVQPGVWRLCTAA